MRYRLTASLVLVAALAVLAVSGCAFSEYSQSAQLPENVDAYRTGCEIDTDRLMEGYKQYDANRLHHGVGPTPTPRPISNNEYLMSMMLERTWEQGCATGRRDAVGAEQANLMALRDELQILADRIAEAINTLAPTPAPPTGGTPTPTPSPEPPTAPGS